MSQQTQLQGINEIERNSIGLATLAAKEVSGLLDVLVSSLSTQYHQYLKHHWVVQGPEHRDLHMFFEEAYMESQKHMDEVAERMTTLGAVPVSTMRGQAERSFIAGEEEGVLPIRDMLKSDLENEQAIIGYANKVIHKASELADFGSETLLKGILVARQKRAHEIDHYLGRDTLLQKSADPALPA